MGKKLTTEEFIIRAKKVHGNVYDYSKVDYKGKRIKIEIICDTHGLYLQNPSDHLSGSQCQNCGKKIAIEKTISNIEDFISKAKKVHGDVFDYSESVYVKSKAKINIKCVKHGFFKQTVSTHLKGSQCPECSKEKQKSNTYDFIFKSKLLHGNLYDYSKVDYISDKNYVNLICGKHGDFKIRAGKHLQGQGCNICKLSKGELFIRKWLEENSVKFEQQKKFTDCKHILKLPYDFYLESSKTLIEFQGQQHFNPIKYWGGQITFEGIQHRDKIKKDYAKSNGFNFIEITYKHTWQEIRDILKNAWEI